MTEGWICSRCQASVSPAESVCPACPVPAVPMHTPFAEVPWHMCESTTAGVCRICGLLMFPVNPLTTTIGPLPDLIPTTTCSDDPAGVSEFYERSVDDLYRGSTSHLGPPQVA